MKKSITIFAVLACSLAVVAAGAAAGTAESTALATHTLHTLEGDDTTLAAFRGQVVVVNFWATWCAPCRKELPLLDRWNAGWSGRGARVVAVSIDKDRNNASRYARGADLSLTVLHDGPDGLARTLDLAAVPSTYLLDRDGRVITVIHGSSGADLKKLHRRVETLLTNQRAAVTDGGTR